MIGDNVTEYEKRALDPCWQHKQKCIAMFTLDSHNTSYLYRREDRTYYWQHCRRGIVLEDDIFVDADGLQLDLFGNPILHKEWILKSNIMTVVHSVNIMILILLISVSIVIYYILRYDHFFPND